MFHSYPFIMHLTFIRCIEFKYCVFTTFKLYNLRRKQLSVFPHSCSSFSVQAEINDVQPNPSQLIKGSHYHVWLVFIKAMRVCMFPVRKSLCFFKGFITVSSELGERTAEMTRTEQSLSQVCWCRCLVWGHKALHVLGAVNLERTDKEQIWFSSSVLASQRWWVMKKVPFLGSVPPSFQRRGVVLTAGLQ